MHFFKKGQHFNPTLVKIKKKKKKKKAKDELQTLSFMILTEIQLFKKTTTIIVAFCMS